MLTWMRDRGFEMYLWLFWLYGVMFVPLLWVTVLEAWGYEGYSRFSYCRPMERGPVGVFVCYER